MYDHDGNELRIFWIQKIALHYHVESRVFYVEVQRLRYIFNSPSFLLKLHNSYHLTC